MCIVLEKCGRYKNENIKKKKKLFQEDIKNNCNIVSNIELKYLTTFDLLIRIYIVVISGLLHGLYTSKEPNASDIQNNLTSQ